MTHFPHLSIPSRLIILVAAILVAAVTGHALPTDTYATRSVLADGRWVKIAVERSGMVMIGSADLRKWGFADPGAVRVYGYGASRIPDRLDASTYIDDLPPVSYSPLRAHETKANLVCRFLLVKKTLKI